MEKVRDTHFVLRKSTKLQSKRFGAQQTCTKLCGRLDNIQLANILPRALKAEYFATGTEKL